MLVQLCSSSAGRSVAMGPLEPAKTSCPQPTCEQLRTTLKPLLLLQVGKARDHVESGVNELVQAKKYQKSTRKWMCCGLVILLIIIAVIVVVAIRPWRYANNN